MLRLMRDGRGMIDDHANPISIVVRRCLSRSSDVLKRIDRAALAVVPN
jgi:hypothetical protein